MSRTPKLPGEARRGAARTAITRTRALALLFAVFGAGVLPSPAPAGASTPTKTVAFSGHYSGTASLLINNGSVTISSIKGTGAGTLVGVGSVGGKGSAEATSSCNLFGGGGSITGPHGTITLTVAKSSASEACPNSETPPIKVAIHGVAKATGGTGKTNGAHGSLKFTGSLNLGGTSGAQSGHFSIVLTGNLTIDS